MKAPIPCPKCSGTGHYYRGGNCYSCRGKGHQTLADVKANYGHDLHISLDGYSGASVSNSMAEGFTNDIALHNCNEGMILKAMYKHGKVNDNLAHVSCKFADGSQYHLNTPVNTDKDNYDETWANTPPEDRYEDNVS